MKYLAAIITITCLCAACHGGKTPVRKPSFDTEEYCFNGTSIISIDGKWGIADTSGAIVLPARYDSVCYVTDEIAAAKEGRLYYLADKKGFILDETVSETDITETELIRWAGEVSSEIRKSWDEVLDSYEELATLCSSDRPDNRAISGKSAEIRAMLEDISGSMARDQKTRFENIRRSLKDK